MATSLATSVVPVPSSEQSEAPPGSRYRLRKAIAAVHFDAFGKGRIVFLPARAELRVVGASSLCGCLELVYQERLYHMFRRDLRGPWSIPLVSKLAPGEVRLRRIATMAGACV